MYYSFDYELNDRILHNLTHIMSQWINVPERTEAIEFRNVYVEKLSITSLEDFIKIYVMNNLLQKHLHILLKYAIVYIIMKRNSSHINYFNEINL